MSILFNNRPKSNKELPITTCNNCNELYRPTEKFQTQCTICQQFEEHESPVINDIFTRLAKGASR